jgi:hypothetical protein
LVAEPNGWDQWSRHVLAKLDKLDENYCRLDKRLQDIRIEVATLKVKASVWGALAGLVPAAIVVILWTVKQ